MTKAEALEFLKQARQLAKTHTFAKSAQTMKLSSATFQKKLLQAATYAQKAPPPFLSRLSAQNSESELQVKRTGRGGYLNGLTVPQEYFEILGWHFDDTILAKVVKNQLILQKKATRPSPAAKQEKVTRSSPSSAKKKKKVVKKPAKRVSKKKS